MSVTINGTSGVTTPGISNSEGYSGDGLTIAAGAPANSVYVSLSGNMGVGTSSPVSKVHVQSTENWNFGACNIVRESTNASPYRVMSFMLGGDDAASLTVGAYNAIWTYTDSAPVASSTSSGLNAGLIYASYNGHRWVVNGTERARINTSGNLLINSASDVDASAFLSIRGSGTKYSAALSAAVVTSAYQATFWNPNGLVGSITSTGSSTAYVTSSDYRLKDNVAPMVGALEKIAALKPCTFTWVIDGSVDRGFIAHELQEVIPQAVSGEKDAVDDKGNIRPQGVDYGKITPELVAAIQELKARIEILEAK